MNKEQALAAIETLVKEKKLRKNSLAYDTIMDAINNPGKIVPCGKDIGSSRYSSSTSWRNQVVCALMAAGITYFSGNSAPRGGAAGDNISIHLDIN